MNILMRTCVFVYEVQFSFRTHLRLGNPKESAGWRSSTQVAYIVYAEEDKMTSSVNNRNIFLDLAKNGF